MTSSSNPTILIVPAVTPYFLDKGADWFLDNKDKILSARRRLGWWRSNLFVIEQGMALKPSQMAAALIGLGYGRADRALLPGEFSGGGAFFRIGPVGSAEIWQIEFLGDYVERIFVAGKSLQVRKSQGVLSREEFGELARLRDGDYVVHQDHGIGIYRGLEMDDEKAEGFFVIEYAAPKNGSLPDILRVPVALAKKLTPYYGFERPALHRLGSGTWFAARKKVREEVLNIAKELLEFYAVRHSARRPAWVSHVELEQALEESFPYSETPDQRSAMEEISRDLASAGPMDRLLCGDVGFGKTEVALRTAWKAVIAGAQAVVLAPTTVLADQHFRVFRERLEPLGARVAMLSRLVSRKDQIALLRHIAAGEIDVVIGTHRILSSDVSFKNLGLLVIDEEQRFGVLAKEKLKTLRASLDTLSLSATPIPRTLAMALAKLRPVSILRTPPAGRTGVQTFVLPYSRRIVREALGQEIGRNGQAYFLHNRIETMHDRLEELRKILPAGRIGFIHGRMDEREIIKTMAAFRERELDVLVATTIIENGLDLSNVNTLVVADALRLGLGQAHQLRGRVGRGAVQAHAYFLYSPRRLTDIALRRLTALQESGVPGSGLEIAMKDLEIRGAGNILGKQQSGAVNTVGLNLYMQMLSEAVERLKES